MSVCVCILDRELAQFLQEKLAQDSYEWIWVHAEEKIPEIIAKNKETIDCLIFDHRVSTPPLFRDFYEQGILLPLVLLMGKDQQELENEQSSSKFPHTATFVYHWAEVHLNLANIEGIKPSIDSAIARFLQLAPVYTPLSSSLPTQAESNPAKFLILRQQKLAEKLKERLGYLGIYYKRNSQQFFRNLSKQQQEELLKSLKNGYREIILEYFSENSINQEIDEFVNLAFFADISVSRVLEIHMELMDDFSQQLQIEGRSEEILLDYRLALIDIIAHLGEMYRRSIPREDIPLEILTSKP